MQWLPWEDAAYAAVGAAAATRVLTGRVARRATPSRSVAARPLAVAAWTRELAVMFALYSLWQLAGGLSLGRAAEAVRWGRWIYHAEHWLGWPSERSVQSLFVSDHGLLRVLDLYYVVLHIVVTGVCLVWVFARHRDRYPVVRNTLALATAASLLVALMPVAPPRLVPGLGVLDIGRIVGPTVYPATARPGLDQLSAMPSVHVAWALIVAGAVIFVLRSPWRSLAVLYPVFTTAVVVITGNHYFADAAVAAVIIALSGGASLWWAARDRSARGGRPASEDRTVTREGGARSALRPGLLLVAGGGPGLGAQPEDDLAPHRPVGQQGERVGRPL